MFNKKIFVSLFIIFMVCVAGVGILPADDLEIFINGGVTGGKTITPTLYNWDWGTDYIDVLETGSITPEISTGDLGFSAGLNVYFSPNFGASLAVTHTKRTLNLFSEYSVSWAWSDVEIYARDKEWSDTGSVSITPITADLIYRMMLSQHSIINVRVGVGVFLTQLKLDAHMGFAEILETDEFIYFDWFDLKVQADQTDIFVGGDVGIDLEQKISEKLGIYAGIQYFYLPKKEITVEVEPLDEYLGEEGQLYTTEPPDIHWVGPITIKLHLSFFKAFLGIKIYL